MSDPKDIIKSRELLGEGRYTKLEALNWKTPNGSMHSWERASRKGNRRSVVMICRMKPSGRYVFIRQFRPPVENYVLEFPAGLVDGEESYEEAAHRELQEETGLKGEIKQIFSPRVNSPGILAEATALAFMEVDEELPHNQNPDSAPEASEDIAVFYYTLEEARELVLSEPKSDLLFDAKVTSYILGCYHTSWFS